MPYYISDKQADCTGWATIKLVNGVAQTVACHGSNKQAAIDNMVAVSMAEGMKPLGEYFGAGMRSTMNSPAIICDIDDTLIHNGKLIDRVWEYVHLQQKAIFLVTGRMESERAATVAELNHLGVDYDDLFMNNLDPSKTHEFKKAEAEKLIQVYDIIEAIDNDPEARANYAALGIKATDPAKIPTSLGSMARLNSDNPKGTSVAAKEKRQDVMADNELVEPTKIDLADQLKDLLGDVVNFKFLAHGFHWNVRGPMFSQFHEFFQEIYEDADSSIDPIAESIRKLNFDAPFMLSQFMESQPELEPTVGSDPIEMSRKLYQANEDVTECIVKSIALATALNEQGIVNFLAERQDMHAKWQWQLRATVGDQFANAYQIDVEEVAEPGAPSDDTEDQPMPQNPTDQSQVIGDPYSAENQGVQYNSKWGKAAALITRRLQGVQEFDLGERGAAKQIETRVHEVDFELREDGGSNGMSFSGYAAMFNSPSEPIGPSGFIEQIQPGAFKRSLQARNDIKLLFNHDTGQVLGSTRAGTLQLREDERGLMATATFPDTQLGRDTATLIRRGDIGKMSFGFRVPQGGDSWNADGSQRSLNQVNLHEVSIVSFPAYEATTVQMRSIDANVLEQGLSKLESAEKLDADQAKVLREVIAKLEEPGDVVPTASTSIATVNAKAKLALLGRN